MESTTPNQSEPAGSPTPAAATPAPTPPTAPTTGEPDIDLFCPSCGYDLRALQSDACPECGAEIDLDKLRTTGIPWVLGEGLLGKVWGFYRTCEFAGLRPTRFCREVAKPVSLHKARQFRWVMVALLWLTVLVTAGADWALFFYDTPGADDWHDGFRESRISEGGFYASLAGLFLLFLVGFTGLHLVVMHPKSLSTQRQNRAVALGHYACAPLGFLPLLAVMHVAGALIMRVGDEAELLSVGDYGAWIFGLSWLLGGVVVLAYLRTCYVFAGRTAHRSGFAQAGLFLLFPVLWFIWWLLVFVALPAVAFFVYLFFLTW